MSCWSVRPSLSGNLPEDPTVMKRRQQGILTGMPFMANITPRTFIDDAGKKTVCRQSSHARRLAGAEHYGNAVRAGAG